jgi:GNAT superfamily N-acetyltransferase
MPLLSDDVAIRVAQPRDAGRVAAMCAALAGDMGDAQPRFSAGAFRRDGFGSCARFGCLVAERAGRVVGYLLHCPDYDTDLARRSLYVVDLFVEKTARRSGIGRALMAAAAAVGRSRGAACMAWIVHARNRAARRFYAQFGEEQSDTVLWSSRGRRFWRLADMPGPTGPRLRMAEAADVPTVARMLEELLTSQGDDPPPDIAGRLAHDGFGAEPAFRVLLAELAGQPIGYALFWPLYGTELAAAGAMLSDLYVDPSARRSGAGRALLAGVAGRTAEGGGKFMIWPVRRHNAAAIAFYAIVAKAEEGTILCRCAGDSFERLAGLAQAAPVRGR